MESPEVPIRPITLASLVATTKLFSLPGQVVLALTEGQNGHYGGHLYRSEDYGKAGSWEKISSALKGTVPAYVKLGQAS